MNHEILMFFFSFPRTKTNAQPKYLEEHSKVNLHLSTLPISSNCKYRLLTGSELAVSHVGLQVEVPEDDRGRADPVPVIQVQVLFGGAEVRLVHGRAEQVERVLHLLVHPQLLPAHIWGEG